MDLLPDEADVRAGYVVRIEDCPLGGGENRVDLSIEGRKFLLFVEVKIDAREGREQLPRYDLVLRAKAALLNKRPALIYLSPRSPENRPPDIVHATWNDVVFAARQAGTMDRFGERPLFSVLLLQFAAHVAAFT